MGFLEEIVSSTRTVVDGTTYLSSLPAASPHRPARLSAAVAAAGARGALLVEFKRASPGAADPRLPAYTVEEFVGRAEPGGVAGYSCLATESRFEGSVRDVAALAAATPRPVLFKDFVVDPRQIEAAARAGAAAVLLIARLETEGWTRVPIAELARDAHRRGLEVLLEFHEKTELSRVGHVAADMYGVNVRDLDSLRMEPEVAAATLRAANGRRPLLGLSGVASAEDARRFWSAGVDGILVGSAVARASDPARFLAGLRRPAGGTA